MYIYKSHRFDPNTTPPPLLLGLITYIIHCGCFGIKEYKSNKISLSLSLSLSFSLSLSIYLSIYLSFFIFSITLSIPTHKESTIGDGGVKE